MKTIHKRPLDLTKKLTSSRHQSVHGIISNSKQKGAWNVSGNFIGEVFAGFPLDRVGTAIKTSKSMKNSNKNQGIAT